MEKFAEIFNQTASMSVIEYYEQVVQPSFSELFDQVHGVLNGYLVSKVMETKLLELLNIFLVRTRAIELVNCGSNYWGYFKDFTGPYVSQPHPMHTVLLLGLLIWMLILIILPIMSDLILPLLNPLNWIWFLSFKWKNRLVEIILDIGRSYIPGVQEKVEQEVKKVLIGVEEELLAAETKAIEDPQTTLEGFNGLPKNGLSYAQVLDLLKQHANFLNNGEVSLDASEEDDSEDSNTKSRRRVKNSAQDSMLLQPTHAYATGQLSGVVYNGLDEDLLKLAAQSFSLFQLTNPLHPDLFPGVRKMESEVVAMGLKMYGLGDNEGCGNITTGGTESILMACKTYRDVFFKKKKSIFSPLSKRLRKSTELYPPSALVSSESNTIPEIIAPVTIHAAFDKAAWYFGMKLIKVDVRESDGRVDLNEVKRLIGSNTCMIAASAPNFPHGIIDNITELAKLAKLYDIGMHVDCCLGSFVIAHMKQAGFTDIEPFDFSVDGVTSISCDTHKYGFTPKGTSLILYRDSKIRHLQYFSSPEWTGGIYASPTISGSRAGGLVATCWSAMLYMGTDGYVKAAKEIVKVARKIRDSIQSSKGFVGREIEVCWQPMAMVVAIRAKKSPIPQKSSSIKPKPINIYKVGDLMTKKKWNLNALQNPSALHICCTIPTCTSWRMFLEDLEESVKAIATKRDEDQMSGLSAQKDDGNAAIYGMASSIPDKRLVGEITSGYLDVLTMLGPASTSQQTETDKPKTAPKSRRKSKRTQK